MAYWVFQCNPKKYDLAARLEDPEPRISWTVRPHHKKIGAGDVAFLWISGPDAGIRAVMEIETAPLEMPELTNELQYWVDGEDDGPELRVLGRLMEREVNLPRRILLATPELSSLSILRRPQGTNFRVSPGEGVKLMELVLSD